MAWCKVLSGFDKEEETVNFGARTVVENNGSLYETSTIATIQSDDEKVTTELHVFACVQYTRVCVAIDKSITIFENETCDEILLSVSFGLRITCYCISDDGSFLFVVLSNGVLYCLHLLSKGQLIFSKNITKDQDIVLSILLQNDCNKHIDMYLVTKSGAIYRISKFNSKLIEDALLNEGDITLKELIQQIECVQLFKGLLNDEVIYVSVGIISKEVSIAMLSSNMLFMWPSEQCTMFSALGYSYTKLKFYKKSTSGTATSKTLKTSKPSIVRILGRDYPLTATAYKRLTIGIRIGKDLCHVEISIADNKGNELSFSMSTWKLLLQNEADILQRLRSNATSPQTHIIIDHLRLEFTRMHDDQLIKITDNRVVIYMTDATMCKLFAYNHCIDHMYTWLSENIYSVSSKYATFVDVLRSTAAPTDYVQLISESEHFEQHSLIDCELLACAINHIVDDACSTKC